MEKLCLCTEISFVPRGNLRNVNFVQKKIDSPREHYTRFPLVRKNVANYWENQESIFSSQLFSFTIKLGAWCAAKTRACLLRFSALKISDASPRLIDREGLGESRTGTRQIYCISY